MPTCARVLSGRFVSTRDADFVRSAIAGVTIVERRHVEDARGFLTRLYSAGAFESAGVTKPIVQVNHTLTRRAGAIRGMHFQRPPGAETKVVACIRGEVFDVAVDLRRDSPTFLKWHGEVLSSANRRSLVIPEGVAHGFQALSPDCELVYLHTAPYEPSLEAGVSALDPRVGIQWPMPVSDMSARDRSHPLLSSTFEGLVV